ncbi:MAG: hypothetical protein BM563_00080 [Bacteroidetes bacterium MedPE-SWsnd-G1]|nr:MAG: hypothetical protein BM563_00080 [Bacteroidetes bacterium MedPE-SWsnd-G1]
MTNEVQNFLLTDAIQNIIHSSRTGAKKLSKNRIASYGSFKKIIEGYEIHLQKSIYVQNINLDFLNKFSTYLEEEKKYSNGYSLKKIADLKTICLNAEQKGFKIDTELKTYKALKEKKQHIIYLTSEELEMIKIFPLFDSELENARKWLLLGCEIGQRSVDLLKINESSLTSKNGIEVIELTQEKTGKQIAIPIRPSLRLILYDGFPTKKPLHKLNEQIKKICKLCGINQKIEGVLYDFESKRRTEGVFEKHRLITAHVCRRTFAINNYGKMQSRLLRQITGHSTETILLEFIGKKETPQASQTLSLF